jgi:hypothetical protein
MCLIYLNNKSNFLYSKDFVEFFEYVPEKCITFSVLRAAYELSDDVFHYVDAKIILKLLYEKCECK